ncbi:L-fuconate dehydratase [Saccharopolyspora erythraea NRRL 2338]|uniref:Mandelate racemase/muconate lactonizing enzyme n=2 Tax=Saccharopolyspora erythraea TaxID=1836 RepID=A4FB83_SACEN|nr:enolase C-terminal domain-like protein [Saccharopolyspora erythraea]EQD83978.1 fuconate dehydratase [Saccharopolyspora erythraea D]PFG95090.1 L-fuconate dehydratase [Saccharopolyspora erythraea NRRL 2338]QRK91768.1 fuconate dehydratase [Saccharopolyspora erythraea]CAM01308.1 mandelate racemase/muconate lactonizing enzyme [Saccharopolyspora erythraea NRRL 2338]
MTARVVDFETVDLRFPTSRQLDGSDAMNPAPDYSAAYVVLRTDHPAVPEGHGFTFTIGRGNDLVVAAVRAVANRARGIPVDDIVGDLGAFARHLTADSQLRWLGPDKGVIHLATAAVVNAAWDLAAKLAGKPVWKLLADMSPREITDLVDWRYLRDALTPEAAVDLLERAEPGRAEREARIRREGYPAYTTSAGWLGYDDAKLRRLCQQAVDEGWDSVKLKVGADLADDRRRCRIAREIIGPDRRLMIDANQTLGVAEAVEWHRGLAEFGIWWFEEPTSPDDVLGHATIQREIAPTHVATGEHAHNPVMFKQFLQAGAIGICQIDACRLGGVNEAVASILLAAAHGVPVCPHAGGVGLCELVQHLSIFDYVAVSGELENRVIEYVDHLHEHFLDPVRLRDGRYLPPEAPGYSAEIRRDTLERYRFPGGGAWH